MSKELVIIQDGFPALSSTFILDQMVGLLERGFDYENWAVVKMDDSEAHPEVIKHNLMDRTRFVSQPDSKLPSGDAVKEFAAAYPEIDFRNIKAVHVHYGSMFNGFSPIFKHWDGFVLVSFHGHDASREFKANGDNCYEYLFERANLITTPSEFMKQELVKRGANPDKILIHRYGIDLERFNPTKRVQNKSGKIRILSVGRFVEKKGLHFAISSLALLPNRENIEYRIIGKGPLEEQFKMLISKLNLEDTVKLLGAKSKEGVVEEMSQADIFMLPSITAQDGDMEGVPVALTEAHAMGLPVISTYHSGIPELVINEKTGLLSKEGDVNALAQDIQILSSSKELRDEFSKNARIRAEEEFNIRTLNDKLAEYLSLART